MGFLSLPRREGGDIRLTIDSAVDTEKLLMQLLRDGITIHIGAMHGSQVTVGIEAPKQIHIARGELLEE